MKLWAARDIDNFLCLYKNKPIINGGIWYAEEHGDSIGCLDDDDFPEVTFENSPQELELNLVKK